MTPTIMFMHGMFLNPKSWEKWQAYFEEKGYRTLAPPWPLHDGDPAQLRAGDEGLRGLLARQEGCAEAIQAGEPEDHRGEEEEIFEGGHGGCLAQDCCAGE